MLLLLLGLLIVLLVFVVPPLPILVPLMPRLLLLVLLLLPRTIVIEDSCGFVGIACFGKPFIEPGVSPDLGDVRAH